MALFGRQFGLTVAPTDPAKGRVAAENATRGESEAIAPPGGGKSSDSDFRNILAMVPAEAIAPFVSFKGTPAQGFDPYVWGWTVFGVCLLICVALRAVATQPSGAGVLQNVNRPLVFFSAVAFFIWAHATTNDNELIKYFHGPFAGLIAIAYGLIVPKFVPASARA